MKWFFYSLGFLLTLLIESSALGHRTFFGAKLSLIPSYLCCVTCREGHERGGAFTLCATLFWALSGVTGGPVFMALLPASCIAAAYLCNACLTRSLLPVMAGCLFSLALCQGGLYLLRLYLLEPMPPDALRLLLIQIALSMIPTPLFWWLTRTLERMGSPSGT